MNNSGTLMEYLPIIITVLVAGGFVSVTMFATHILGPKRKTKTNLKHLNAVLNRREMHVFHFQ